jgi:hypothetical protein
MKRSLLGVIAVLLAGWLMNRPATSVPDDDPVTRLRHLGAL